MMLLGRAKNIYHSICQSWTTIRFYKPGQPRSDKIKINPPGPPRSPNTCDWIGPPDPDSNVRPIKFHVADNESTNEKAYRESREELQTWNHEFWAKHNREFVQGKDEFIRAKLNELGRKKSDGSTRRLTAEQMSEFYKQFLDHKYQLHKEYNRDWYRKNIQLLWPALKVKIENIGKSWRR